MLPLKRSASFKISVDKVEVAPVIKYQTALEDLNEDDINNNEESTWPNQNGVIVNGHHKQNGGINHDDVSPEEVEEEADDEAPVNIINGADWESVNYRVQQFDVEDEVTGLAVSEEYIVAQFFMEPDIHVFDRHNMSLIHRLTGHDYGGQAVQILDHVLYSGSKDCSLRSWDLKTGKQLASVTDHRDYIQCLCVARIQVAGLGEDGADTALASGGAADHRVILYSTDVSGKLRKRYQLDGHSGWITCIQITNTMIITGSKDCNIKLWDTASGDLLQSLTQDAEITCLSTFSLKPGYLIFGDGESKVSLLDLAMGSTIHLMPNTLVGTGRYRRSSKYHDKAVDVLSLSDNGYMVTASSGSRFAKIWKLEKYEDCIMKTDVTELQIIRDHPDYLSVLSVYGNSIVSSSGDGKVFVHTFPEGEQHYDMLRTQERNSVAVLFKSGQDQGLAPSVEAPTIVCEGRLCKAGKTGLARSSSSFQVSFSLNKSTTASAVGKLVVPQTIAEEDSDDEDESSAEFVIEYVTDSDPDLSDGDEEW